MALMCFVAMAFGHEECDKVYDKLIAPTLQKLGVKAIRIDRIEHNEDIDDKIISELQSCDFAVADLTYARPSVYFEAGYAQRKVPVIYSCRKDHFSPRRDDQFGNFRVHFDLQMKNIIPWSNPSDRKFCERLSKRVNRIIIPMMRVRQIEETDREEAEKFGEYSLEEKTQRILGTCVCGLKRAGYQQRSSIYEYSPLLAETTLTKRPIPGSEWLGSKNSSGTLHAALVYVTASLSQTILRKIFNRSLRNPTYNINLGLKTGNLRHLAEDVFLCSLKKIGPLSRAMASLPNYRLDRKRSKLFWVGNQTVPRGKVPGFRVIYTTTGLWGHQTWILGNLKKSEAERYWVSDNGMVVSGPADGIPLKRIPRRVSIRIFDDIKFEAYFEKLFNQVVKLVDSESV